MRILVADNNMQNRNALATQLVNMKYNIEEAISASDVLQICKNDCPHLLFLSDNLAGMYIIELVKQIRALGGDALWSHVVITYTTFNEGLALAGLDAGADDILHLPIDNIKMRYKTYFCMRQMQLREQVFNLAHNLTMAYHAFENGAMQDSLTGILDINAFYHMLEAEWIKAKDTVKSLSLILIDLDNFASFNEAYGAVKGDAVIKEVADNLKNIAPHAKLARTTGTTFAFLLPNYAKEALENVANTILQMIEKQKIPHFNSPTGFVTVSIGISMVSKIFKTPLDLFEVADYALYQAKHTGRNKAVFSTVEEQEQVN